MAEERGGRMMTFLIGTMVGAVIGIGTMCFMVVAAEEDRWMEKKDMEKKWKDM